MRITIQDVITGRQKENARKMSSGCRSTADLAVACVLKVQRESISVLFVTLITYNVR